jgi:hypothetical protein
MGSASAAAEANLKLSISSLPEETQVAVLTPKILT